jgi:hypothetical protein
VYRCPVESVIDKKRGIMKKGSIYKDNLHALRGKYKQPPQHLRYFLKDFAGNEENAWKPILG